ncbi:hypothetical protein E2C01_036645 [Portunus trituberculatus]|uniref:Uncharacterized protein n=1 Tax=Portunus trituberculatus TaxID=210409 RepID=A0A5B7F624_PORTR|nr:hypothetical protein [Portunus trituberculatus]
MKEEEEEEEEEEGGGVDEQQESIVRKANRPPFRRGLEMKCARNLPRKSKGRNIIVSVNYTARAGGRRSGEGEERPRSCPGRVEALGTLRKESPAAMQHDSGSATRPLLPSLLLLAFWGAAVSQIACHYPPTDWVLLSLSTTHLTAT